MRINDDSQKINDAFHRINGIIDSYEFTFNGKEISAKNKFGRHTRPMELHAEIRPMKTRSRDEKSPEGAYMMQYLIRNPDW